jgi:superoxide dismutase
MPNIRKSNEGLGSNTTAWFCMNIILARWEKGAPSPDSSLMSKLFKDFKGFERWKKQFVQIGNFRGVGWVVLSYDPFLKRLTTFGSPIMKWGNVAGFVPILVMDVWEHAYVLDFGSLARPEWDGPPIWRPISKTSIGTCDRRKNEKRPHP